MKRFLGKYATSINLLMVTAVVYVALHTWLSQTPERFAYGSEFGDVAYDACLAYATAWLFQWLVIARPAKRQRQRLDELIAPRIDHLIEQGIELATVIRAQHGLDPAFPIARSEIVSACATANPGDKAPGWVADWHEMIDDLSGFAAIQRSALKPFYSNLDHSLFTLLELEEARSDLLARVGRASAQIKWNDMTKFAEPAAGWLEAVESLRQYRIKHLAPGRAVPEPDPRRSDHKRAPIAQLGKMRAEIDELVRSFDELTDESEHRD